MTLSAPDGYGNMYDADYETQVEVNRMKIVAAVILFFPALAQTQQRAKPAPQSEPPKTHPALRHS